FGGDTCYGESYRQGGAKVVAEKGYAYSIQKLVPLLRSVDLRVLNLETPLTAHRAEALPGKDYLHYSDPVKLPEIFAAYRPLAFSLANNHSLDQGTKGLDDTFAALDSAGIEWFGAGKDLARAEQPLLKKLRVGDRTVTLAVFGGFEYRAKYDLDFHFYAGADRAGTAPIDVKAARKAITRLRRDIPEVFVVYFAHWGENYRWKNAAQTAMAHALRAAGVDLVIGAHAHAMQEVEWDGRGWIFYGLGNFLFNAPGRYAANDAAPFSLPLVVNFSIKDGHLQAGLRVYPIASDNQLTAYQPRLVTGLELAAVEALLATESKWDGPTHAAVKRGIDEIGRYLEFTGDRPAAR
ncbi:MAG TPA: CapA family protein, partial [Chthoniobacterales bacterium]|nr:CapA family protein [Chthoniobacterales bacterium]